MADLQPDNHAIVLATPTSDDQNAINGENNASRLGLRLPFQLISFPNELLYHVASCLKPWDLFALSLVSKRVASIAQEQLHESPMIYDIHGSSQRSCIALLARTLSSRPDLARKVRAPLFRPSTCMVDFETCKYVSTDHWIMGEWRNESTLFKRETMFAGDILRSVSNMQFLTLQILRQDEDKYDPDFRPDDNTITGHLFGVNLQYELDGQPCLNLISGLKDLEVLSLSGSAIHGAWRDLPRLRQLNAAGDSRLINLPECSQATHIKFIELDKSTYVLSRRYALDQSIGDFLAGQASVEYLAVTLCNLGLTEFEEDDGQFWGWLTSPHEGDFNGLVWNLTPVASTVDELVIVECAEMCHGHKEHASFLEYLTPITSLAHFKHLRVLELPHEALIPQQRPVAGLFPPTLEHLKIHAPRVSIYWLFHQMGLDWTNLPCFNTLELFTYKDRGDSYEEFAFRLSPIWTLLRANQIFVRIYWDTAQYCQDWGDREYDPFVCEIVEFLKGLTQV